MRLFKFLFALGLTSAFIWALSNSQTVSGKQLPAFGPFFNPFSGFWNNAEPSKGLKCHDLKIPNLQSEVQVQYDDMLVPHIFAKNQRDAMRVQGFITAQHRLFQMEISSRRAAGRLSEVLGERTFELDRSTRRKGIPYAAENNLISWKKSPESFALVEAYSEGVNAYIDQMNPGDLPVEFKLLGFQPEKWSPLRTSLILEAMAETLCAREDDLEATNALLYFGRETFDYLYPEWNPKQTPIVPDTGQWSAILTRSPKENAPLHEMGGVAPSEDWEADPYQVGSNNWALSGQKTKSGKSILANDPHLNLTLPSIWFQVQIHTPEANTYGVSLPGVMGIVIGFNEQAAWGLTNVGHDVSDYYKITWADAARTKYQLDGKEQAVQFRMEDIGIKGKPSFKDTVRYTTFGPLPFDNDASNPLRDYALRWIAHNVTEMSVIDGFEKLNSMGSHADYLKAIAGIDAPAQNVVFASRSGDIAIQVQGRLPIRQKEQGRFLQEGTQSANNLTQFIPQSELPGMKNPSRGFVFSANQHSTPPSYPYYFLADFEDYRSRRIFNRLTNMQSATVDSMKTMQLDNFSQKAADALPAMLRLLDKKALDSKELEMVGVLESWNFRYDGNLLAPTLFEVWSDSCYMLTWDEMAAINKPILFPDGWRWIEMLQNDTSSVFFDIKETPGRETARQIVLESFKQMKGFFDKNPTQKVEWRSFRPFELRHLTQLPAFSRLDLKPSGHKTAPNAVSMKNGPSWRMIVEYEDQIKALGVYPGGQSGNPGSQWYDNMAEMWAKGEYCELLFLKDQTENSPRIIGKQRFVPAS